MLLSICVPFLIEVLNNLLMFLEGFCVYKGVTYMQGQKWDDGCDYTCDCYDAEHGKYRCNPK